VDELEIPQLVACLERLIRDPDVRRQLGRNAKAFVDRYTTFEFAAKLCAHALNSAGRPELRHAPEVIARELRFERDWEEASPEVEPVVEQLLEVIPPPPPVSLRRALPLRITRWALRPIWLLARRGLRPFVARFDAHMARLFDNVLHERIDHRVATLPHLVAVRDEMVSYVGTLNGNLNTVQRRLTSSMMTREIDDRLVEAARDISRLRHQVESLREAVEMQAPPASMPIIRGIRRKDRPYLSRGRRGSRDAA